MAGSSSLTPPADLMGVLILGESCRFQNRHDSSRLPDPSMRQSSRGVRLAACLKAAPLSKCLSLPAVHYDEFVVAPFRHFPV